MRTKKEGGCGKAHVIRSLLHGATYGKESGYVPVLAPGCAVQVNNQLKAVIIGSCDRVSEIRKLSLNSLDVRFSRADLPDNNYLQ